MTYDKLTERELEVVKKIAEGYPSQEIADLLFISPSTVKVHRKNMMRKMNVRNSTSLVSKCITNGWI
jgi:DNA-binding NarL/FixJ family response regulator